MNKVDQNRYREYGTYAGFNHEPGAEEIAATTQKILEALCPVMRNTEVYESRVIYRIPEQYEQSYIADPLEERKKSKLPARWTIGIKLCVIVLEANLPEEVERWCLREGVDALEI